MSKKFKAIAVTLMLIFMVENCWIVNAQETTEVNLSSVLDSDDYKKIDKDLQLDKQEAIEQGSKSPDESTNQVSDDTKEKDKKKKLVKYKDESQKKTKDKFVKQDKNNKLKLKSVYNDTVDSMMLDSSQVQQLSVDSEVLAVEDDGMVEISGKVDTADTEKNTWNLSYINADIAQKSGYTGKKVKVAVFDTGIDKTNPDLNVAGGVSFVEGVTSYMDDNGHGTAMASILASLNNKIGIVGVAPDVKLYSVKVLDKDGKGNYSSIIQGIQWAIDNDMDIISMSFGGTQYSSILEDVISDAIKNNILVVAAAGNENSGVINYPAKYSKVVCVGAVDNSGKKAWFSNSGAEMDLVAPGVDIETITKGNQLVKVSGTSPATPQVAGVAALLLSGKSNLSVDSLKAILYNSAAVVPNMKKNEYGWGVVNAYSSIENIDKKFVLDEYSERDLQYITQDSGENGTVVTSTIVYGDYQTISVGQTATVQAAFSSAHDRLEVTVLNSSGVSLYPIVYYSPIYGNGAVKTYTTPAFTSPGQYTVRYHCTDNVVSTWDDVFHITVNAVVPPAPSDEYGNSPGTAYNFNVSAGTTNSISGNLQVYNDIDYFKFTAPSTGTYTIFSNNISVDVYAEIFDSALTSINHSDDEGGNMNFLMSNTLTKGQVHYVYVRHYATNGTGSYTLNITAPAGDTTAPTTPTLSKTAQTATNATFTWTAATDNVGVSAYDVFRNGALIGSVASAATSYSDNISSLSAGTYSYTVKARDAAGNTSGFSNSVPIIISADDFGNAFSSAYNLTVSTATVTSKNGILEVNNDIDYFKFTAPATGLYNVYSTNITVDVKGWLYNSSQTELTNNDDSNGSTNFSMSASLTQGQVYYIKVSHYNSSGTGNYMLNISYLGTVTDDVGNTTALAYNLGAISTSGITKAGNIEMASDVDFFKFTVSTAGIYSIRTSGSTDTMGLLYNSSGTTIGSEVDDVNGTNFVITSILTANTTYYVRVRGYSSNTGAYTLLITPAPSTPTSLTKTAQTSTSVSLSWTASTSSAGTVSYKIYRGSNLVGTTSSTTFTNTIVPTTTSGSFVYTVKAVDSAGNWSLASNSVSVDVQLPTAPTNLVITSQNDVSMSLSWSASTDNFTVAGYYIYRDSVQIATCSTTSFTDSNIWQLAANNYNYAVKAYDSAGNISAASSSVVLAKVKPDWYNIVGENEDGVPLQIYVSALADTEGSEVIRIIAQSPENINQYQEFAYVGGDLSYTGVAYAGDPFGGVVVATIEDVNNVLSTKVSTNGNFQEGTEFTTNSSSLVDLSTVNIKKIDLKALATAIMNKMYDEMGVDISCYDPDDIDYLLTGIKVSIDDNLTFGLQHKFLDLKSYDDDYFFVCGKTFGDAIFLGLFALGTGASATGASCLYANAGISASVGLIAIAGGITIPVGVVIEVESLASLVGAVGLTATSVVYAKAAVKAKNNLDQDGITKQNLPTNNGGNFRSRFLNLTGGIYDRFTHAHHMLPQASKFRSFFNKVGIDVHDAKYGSWVPAFKHLSEARAFNNDWKAYIDAFIESGVTPSLEEVLVFARSLATKYGYNILF